MEEDSRSTRMGSSHSRNATTRTRRSSRSGRVLPHGDDEEERKPPAGLHKSVPKADHSQLPPKPQANTIRKTTSPNTYPSPCDAAKGAGKDISTHTESTRTSSSRRSVRKVEDDDASICSPAAPQARKYPYPPPASSFFHPHPPPQQQSQRSRDIPQTPYASAGRIMQQSPTTDCFEDEDSMDVKELLLYAPKRKTAPQEQTTMNITNPWQQRQSYNRPSSRAIDRDAESTRTPSTVSNVSSVCTEELIVAKMYAANGGRNSGFHKLHQQYHHQPLYPTFDTDDADGRWNFCTDGKSDGAARPRTLSAGQGVILSEEATEFLLHEKRRQKQDQEASDHAMKQQLASRSHVRKQYGDFPSSGQSLLSDDSRADSLTTAPDPPSLAQRQHYIRPGAFRMTSDGHVEPPTTAYEDIETPSVTPTGSLVRDYPPPCRAASPTTSDRRIRRNSPRGHHRNTSSPSTMANPQAGYMVEASLVADRLANSRPPTASASADGGEEPSQPWDAPPTPPPPPGGAQFATSLGEVTTGTSVASPIVEAHRVDEYHAIRMFFQNRKVQFGISLLTALFVVLVVGTVVGVKGAMGRDDLKPPGDAAGNTPLDDETVEQPPTSSPTMENDLDLTFFARTLPPYTQETLRLPDSAQSSALRWLRDNNTLLETYSLDRRIQRFVLATFYYSTRGDKRWVNKAGWLTDEHECGWYQDGAIPGGPTFLKPNNATTYENMVCNDKEELIRLSLGRGGLRGTFPAEIGLLTSLASLKLPENIITGSLPSTMGQLSKLQVLQLWDNYLSGSIPSNLDQLNELEILNLEFNFIAQVIPRTLGKLTNLRELVLDRNVLVGTMPNSFGQLESLEKLHLFVNAMTGTLPTSLGSLTNLTDVQLEFNTFSGSIPTEIGMWENIVILNLFNNSFSGTLPSELGNCQQLTYLDVFGNELTGQLPSELGRLTSAERLYFEHNQLGGTLPSELGDLVNITKFWIQDNQISGSIPTEIGFWSKLTDLNVSGNQLSGSLPSELGLLTNVQSIFLRLNQMKGRIPSEIGYLTQLTRLALEDNGFTGEVPDEVCQLVNNGTLDVKNFTADCSRLRCGCCNCFSND